MNKIVILLFVAILSLSIVSAQDGCSLIVETAIATADEACAEMGRNQACYGNFSIEAEAKVDAPDFSFSEAGDIIDLVNLRTLRLASMDTSADEWGIAILKVQANVPDTIPGQNVQFVLFGNVEIEDASDVQPALPTELEVTISGSLNVRGGPSTSDVVVGGLDNGDVVIANGRNAAGDWIRVIRNDDGDFGWIYTPLVEIDGEASELLIVTGEAEADPPPSGDFGPMQAFYLKTGVGDGGCAEAPNGVMIQTPEVLGKIELVMNGVQISLGSTAYIESDPTEMTLAVLEGESKVTATSGSAVLPGGTQITIEFDADRDSLSSDNVEKTELNDVETVPLDLLDREIEITTFDGPIASGQWEFKYDIEEYDCPGADKYYHWFPFTTLFGSFGMIGWTSMEVVSLTDSHMVINTTGTIVLIETGEFYGTTTDTWEIDFISPVSVVGTRAAHLVFSDGDECPHDVGFTATYVGDFAEETEE